jgi:hypothetical protein
VVCIDVFTSEIESPFKTFVTKKVVQVVTNTHRFSVIDKNSLSDMLEFQKSEEILDEKIKVTDYSAQEIESYIKGHIQKINIYTMKNPDGSVNGYKASAAFTLQVMSGATGVTTEAESFQTEVSPLAMSKEQAVNQTLQSIEPKLKAYFIKTFPMKTKIVKMIDNKRALIAGGKTFGFKEGDKLTVERIEMLEGKPYPTEIGELKITKIAGDDFSECSISKGSKEILAAFNAAVKLTCKLIVK